jgi:hypothetical protein
VGQKAVLERKLAEVSRQRDREVEELRTRLRAAEERAAQPPSPSKIALNEVR